MSSDLSDDEKRDLISIVGGDVESTAAMVIGGFDVDEFAVANVMNVGEQHYHVALQIQPIPEEKAEEIKENLGQARNQRGEPTQ